MMLTARRHCKFRLDYREVNKPVEASYLATDGPAIDTDVKRGSFYRS
jgi:hypothetical protein